MINITNLIRNTIVKENVTEESHVFNYMVDDHFHEKPISLLCGYTHYHLTQMNTLMIVNLLGSIIIKLIFGGLRMNRMNRPKNIESLKKMDFQSYYREPLYESEVMSFRHIIRVKGSILSIQNGGKLND